MLTWIIIIVILIIIILRMVHELHCLKVTHYELHTEKLKGEGHVRMVFISDLHLRRYGEENERLITEIENQNPDMILIGGDMTVKSEKAEDQILYALLTNLVEIAPVYYASGNHEVSLKENARFETDRFEKLLEKCDESGVTYLANESKTIETQAGEVCITGLELSYDYYDKRVRRPLKQEELTEYLGEPDRSVYNILLAHPPAYLNEYAVHGTDLVLAGHYHGGAIRFGKLGLVSPQVRFFPKYSAGKFVKDKTTMIVTRGVGSHSVNMRLFNYPEIVVVDLSAK